LKYKKEYSIPTVAEGSLKTKNRTLPFLLSQVKLSENVTEVDANEGSPVVVATGALEVKGRAHWNHGLVADDNAA
jgi:hypothetical protein